MGLLPLCFILTWWYLSLPQASPVAIRVFIYKYNLLIISSIKQLHYIFNEEEY